MASAWGSSWSSYWGNAWGVISSARRVGGDYVRYYTRRKKRRDWDTPLLDAAKQAYEEVFGFKPSEEVIEEIVDQSLETKPLPDDVQPVNVQSLKADDSREFNQWLRLQIELIERIVWEMRELEDEEAILLLM